MDGQIEWVNQVLKQYLQCITNYHQNNWSKLLAMVEFVYNNIVHSLTQQTSFFANHGLHHKFNIQGVHKIVNLTIKDQAMWLVDVRAQLVCNLEEVRTQYKEMLMNVKMNNSASRSRTRFGFDNKILRQQGH
jgi:hypothetical protein